MIARSAGHHDRPVATTGGPRPVMVARCNFRSIDDATQVVMAARRLGVGVARVELLDEVTVRACNRYSGLKLIEAPTLLTEFHGDARTTAWEVAKFKDLAVPQGARSFEQTGDRDEAAQLWTARHDAWWAIHALHPGKEGVTTDVCVPISRLANCIGAADSLVNELGLDAAIVGHVGDGNFHVLVMLDPTDVAEHARARSFVDRLNTVAIDLGGTCSGEHGIGQGKRAAMAAEHGDALSTMRRLKLALDPLGLLNPGKMLPDADGIVTP